MIISFDPSGNFTEGNGTTGIGMYDPDTKVMKVDEIRAADYSSPEEYWNAHIKLLHKYDFHISHGEFEVVMEGFRLYGHKADTQTNSILETPQLIGCIRLWCFSNEVPLKIQYAVEVKNRWSDDVLLKKGIITKGNGRRKLVSSDQWLNNHKTDAVRHMLHYLRYKRGK